MTIEVLDGRYAVCKIGSALNIPFDAQFFSLTVTDNEVSLVCEESQTPVDCEVESGFALMRIVGTLDFKLVGILYNISSVLAQENVSIFAISTFDTDYILVKHCDLPRSIDALKAKGYFIMQ